MLLERYGGPLNCITDLHGYWILPFLTTLLVVGLRNRDSQFSLMISLAKSVARELGTSLAPWLSSCRDLLRCGFGTPSLNPKVVGHQLRREGLSCSDAKFGEHHTNQLPRPSFACPLVLR